MTTTNAWNELAARAEAISTQEAADPSMYEPLMNQCHMWLIDCAQLLARVNEERYEAERKWATRKNTTMTRYIEHGVTFARAQGEVAAMEEREQADNLKVIFHHAEDTQKAIQAKHYALLNLNRGMQSAMFEGGRRG